MGTQRLLCEMRRRGLENPERALFFSWLSRLKLVAVAQLWEQGGGGVNTRTPNFRKTGFWRQAEEDPTVTLRVPRWVMVPPDHRRQA